MNRLGVIIATNREHEAAELVEVLLHGDEQPFRIAVVFQGDVDAFGRLRTATEHGALRAGYDGLRVERDPGSGASRSRNRAIALVDDAEWLWTPNDTSRPEPGLVNALSRHLESAVPDDVGAVALDYAVNGESRRSVSDAPELTGWSLWRAIEPALIWRRSAVTAAGGFDERIGTGSPGWAQSGEGTDLLCRLGEHGFSVGTFPGVVEGRVHHQDRRFQSVRRKEFYYGVGFGCIARRHFPLLRSLATIVTPTLRWLSRTKYEGARPQFHVIAVATAGRTVGLLLGERSWKLVMKAPRWK